jgi:zinc and cadmium transporter
MNWSLLVIYCLLICGASYFGGWLPAMIRMTHLRIQRVISLVAGVMLGVAMLHLLPESIHLLDNTSLALQISLIGLLFMFFLVRMFHFHQHDLEHEEEHHGDCQHDHHIHGHEGISWIGLATGLSVHTILDGLALAASVKSGSVIHPWLAGFAIFLAIVLHKPLDAMSITSLMTARGWSTEKQKWANLIFSCMCPLGALLFALGFASLDNHQWYLGAALAFSAGVFLCISLGDLLPEVHFHTHYKIELSIYLILGVAIAGIVQSLPGHSHDAVPENTLQHSTDNSIDNKAP